MIRSLICASLLSVALLAKPFPTPVRQASSIAAFVPSDYQIEVKTEVDLSGDGLPDTVLVLVKKEKDGEERPRAVVILFKEAKGGYTLAATNTGLLASFGDCGVNGGDCTPEVSVRKNVVSFTQVGGSRIGWSNTHRFRFNAATGAMECIGYDSGTFDKLSQEGEEVSINYLTGTRIKTLTPAQADESGNPLKSAPAKQVKKDKVSDPVRKLEEIETVQ